MAAAGHTKTGGRRKGTLNKATAGVKAAFRKCEKALNWQRAMLVNVDIGTASTCTVKKA